MIQKGWKAKNNSMLAIFAKTIKYQQYLKKQCYNIYHVPFQKFLDFIFYLIDNGILYNVEY